jgi:hypothetical protein
MYSRRADWRAPVGTLLLLRALLACGRTSGEVTDTALVIADCFGGSVTVYGHVSDALGRPAQVWLWFHIAGDSPASPTGAPPPHYEYRSPQPALSRAADGSYREAVSPFLLLPLRAKLRVHVQPFRPEVGDTTTVAGPEVALGSCTDEDSVRIDVRLPPALRSYAAPPA